MVAEEATVALKAQMAAATALVFGRGSRRAAGQVIGTYRRAIRRNRRRLASAKARGARYG